MDIKEILRSVENGTLTAEEALLKIKMQPFVDIGYAKLDTQRKLRQGVSEIIYGEGKTPEQILGILNAMAENGQKRVLITRLSKEKYDRIAEEFELRYSEEARLGILGSKPAPDGLGKILVLTGGTSDIPVAEEAAVTAEMLGNEVVRIYDVGVAGLHRLLSYLDTIMNASVIIAVAGMEGALASVAGGLADCPVIAVPTSVGYGSSFGGMTALLAMMNSCASNVSVVNIDNGFGAGFQASRINHMEIKK
ncbi:MAG: nickel pincer cofactor biosynthesis protein LarB [Lachnospiraceae bacterium]|nr:nickel pincer cofactor biosynthesis protein LarB [Lachnospiraceae bacterium]